jgi:hypothetical protein
LPPALWVTVGTLAQNGLTLQLKVKRLSQKAERRDDVTGGWLVYAPIGGALTVTRKAQKVVRDETRCL